MSGWNPYKGEEEEMYEEISTGEDWNSGRREQNSPEPGEPWENPPAAVRPYFRMPDYEQIVEEQRMTERDLRMLQSMYPEAAKLLLPYIEEECDKMEYEGSAMYDEYPDPTTVRRIQDTILEQVRDQFPEEVPEQPDDVLSMQYGGRRRNPPGKNWLGDLVQVLLLQEIHHRRCRHGRCRRRY